MIKLFSAWYDLEGECTHDISWGKLWLHLALKKGQSEITLVLQNWFIWQRFISRKFLSKLIEFVIVPAWPNLSASKIQLIRCSFLLVYCAGNIFISLRMDGIARQSEVTLYRIIERAFDYFELSKTNISMCNLVIDLCRHCPLHPLQIVSVWCMVCT